MKTLASHGATGEMSVVGRTTSNARVEMSEEQGNVMNGGDQRRRNWGRGTHHCGSCVWNRDDNGGIIVKCVGNLNRRGRLIGSNGSGGRGWRGWCLSLLLSSNVGDYGGGWGNLQAASCLNQERLEAVDDVRGDEFSENIVATVLKVLQCLL